MLYFYMFLLWNTYLNPSTVHSAVTSALCKDLLLDYVANLTVPVQMLKIKRRWSMGKEYINTNTALLTRETHTSAAR